MPSPGKILCVGVNYPLHRQETGRAPSHHPVLFTRFPDSIVGHRNPLVRPLASRRFDYEGELAIVIGKAGRRIPAERALDHVVGYACFLDGSVRDYQRHTPQFTPGKNFPRSGGFGPWLVTRDEIPHPDRLRLRTEIAGETLQDASTGDMIFGIPQLIAYITEFTPLAPGDVIATGTPGGVGDKRSPPRYLTPGDRVRVTIDGVGTLEHTVQDEIATVPE